MKIQIYGFNQMLTSYFNVTSWKVFDPHFRNAFQMFLIPSLMGSIADQFLS